MALAAPGLRVPRADAALAAAASVAGVVTLVTQPLSETEGVTRAADALGVALSLGMTVPVAWRRRAPLPSLGVAGVCALVASNVGYAVTVGALVVWVLVGSAALHTDRRTAMGLVGVGALAVAGSVMTFSPSSRDLLGAVSAAAVGALPPLVGNALRRQRELTSQLRALQARELQAARAQERVAIARDVHDAVGHHLSAIALQARAAGYTAASSGAEPATAVLDRIATLSDRALDDTRRLLGILRDPGPAELAPAAGLGDLPGLVATARLAGVDAELHAGGGLDALPGTLQAGAFRIAQEALTNVARHAGRVRADVRLAVDGGVLRLEVRDHGDASAVGPAGAAGGRGLDGMRERATLLRGTLSAGPEPGGGWAVRAALPVADR